MNIRSVAINDFLSYIGVNDREVQLFESQWPLPDGVTYNSYLIRSDKTALLDTVKVTRAEDFIENLKEALNGRSLDYLVIHHMEPDHSGAIDLVVNLFPDVEIVGNKKAIEFLHNFYDMKQVRTREVKEGDVLDLGAQKLQFFMTPMVHWPESMVSYEPGSGILFSQDIFGSYGALSGGIYDDNIDWFVRADEAARYYSNIVAKYGRQAKKALQKLEALDIKMICSIHGPVWRTHPERIIDLYKRLANWEVEDGATIVFGSMYGNTAQMAEIIARALAQNGVSNIRLFDVAKTHASYLQHEIAKRRATVLLSCSYNNGLFPPMENLCNIIAENKMENHLLGIAGNFSWSGGGLKNLQKFAESQKGFELLEPMVEVRSAVKEADVERLQELAKTIADALKERREDSVKDLLGRA
uniref:FprA family A-type flavoprotein n=1 Tax=Ndongobacter massiliensis TaxID=1871025 RepID=UPI000931F91C|nr:FprA family A-type flavoprotein [Ndongobacter massiliensis]